MECHARSPCLCALLRSDLPIAIYPCATKVSCFDYGPNNSYWKLPDLQFVKAMSPPLRAYLAYAWSHSNRSDFLTAMTEDPGAAAIEAIARSPHNVWETAIWLEITGRRLVRRADDHFRIVRAGEVLVNDTVLPNDLRPCRVEVRDNGVFQFQLTDRHSNFSIYDRGDPRKNERALREALPALYLSVKLRPTRQTSTPNPKGQSES